MEFIRSAGRFQAFHFASYRRFRSNSGRSGLNILLSRYRLKTRIINSFYNKHSPITSNAWGVFLYATWGIEGIIGWLYSGQPGKEYPATWWRQDKTPP
jgi:hypothetical protein